MPVPRPFARAWGWRVPTRAPATGAPPAPVVGPRALSAASACLALPRRTIFHARPAYVMEREDQVVLGGRFVGFELNHVPHHVTRAQIVEAGRLAANVDPTDPLFPSGARSKAPEMVPVTEQNLVSMNDALGRPQGRHLALCEWSLQNIVDFLPGGVTYKPIDSNMGALFAEQAMRMQTVGHDMRRLAVRSNVERTVSVGEFPASYTAMDVRDCVELHTGIPVPLENVVRPFRRGGHYSGEAILVCATPADADIVATTMQEIAVPRHFTRDSLLGSQFVYARRGGLLIMHSMLDDVTASACPRGWVAALGFHGDMTCDEMSLLLAEIGVPDADEVRKLSGSNALVSAAGDGWGPPSANSLASRLQRTVAPQSRGSSATNSIFAIKFQSVARAKRCMRQLHYLSRKWKVPKNQLFFAHLRTPDMIHPWTERPADLVIQDDDLHEDVEY